MHGSSPHGCFISSFGIGHGLSVWDFYLFIYSIWKLSWQLLLAYIYSTPVCYSWWNINDGVDSEGCKIGLVLKVASLLLLGEKCVAFLKGSLFQLSCEFSSLNGTQYFARLHGFRGKCRNILVKQCSWLCFWQTAPPTLLAQAVEAGEAKVRAHQTGREARSYTNMRTYNQKVHCL